MRAIRAFILFLSIATIANAQAVSKSEIDRKGNQVLLKTEGSQCQIAVCTPSMVRVCLAGASGFVANENYMINRYNWDEVTFSVNELGDVIELKTNALIVRIKTKPLRVAFYSADNKLINSDVLSDTPMEYEKGAPKCSKVLQPGEHFFGFGERMDFMDQLGKKLTLDVGRGAAPDHETGAYNILEANYAPVPFFMSTNGYGIFFHNANPSAWDMGNSSPNQYSFSASDGEMDYFFIYGPSFQEIIGQYTQLTGTSPLLPRSALGLHVGTYSGGTWGHEDLASQHYVVALAKKFRELGIPADMLHIDSTWRIFGKINGKGGTSYEWREPGFSDPKSMFDSLYSLHFKMIGLHIRPRIDNGDIEHFLDLANAKGFTYPEKDRPGDFLNFFDESSVDWWWENCMKPLADQGCKFVKTDEGSAFGRAGNELINKTGPQGKEIASLHNLFPIAYAKAPFLKFQEHNNMRGMGHTREGFAGIQRYPFIFAGDWPSQWQYFKPVIRAGLNIGLSGVPAWTHCMGGFEQVADPELYVRWCQFGMFSPVALLFGMEHPNYKEPWTYGDEAQAIFVKYDKLRYRLIPYIYSSYYQSYKNGSPIIRALVFDHPSDVNTYPIDDQYLFGENMLICPVTEKGAKSRTLYLPEGKWIDYWSGQEYIGKKSIIVKTPLDKLPIYIKAGAIIPMQPDMQYVGEKPVDPVTFDIYPSGISSFDLYEDDGLSLDYQKGVFAITKVTCKDINERVYIDIFPSEGSYSLPGRKFTLWVHLDGIPDFVTVNNKSWDEKTKKNDENTWVYDPDNSMLIMTVQRDLNQDLKIEILK
ncbi:MAG TPA: glycoside hydrolase family 31 protein [Prolixibacteraceae bacterium]|nr:glycoside hydrolase family 31 protein [Prolixibacteraceae bacterium]